MSKPQVIIIGAGLAGLSAGIFARLNGFPAQILEHGAQPGGVAATWQRKGYAIDGGIHFHMGANQGSANKLYRQLGAWSEDRFKPVETYMSFGRTGAKDRLEVTGDLDRLAKDLKSLCPGLNRTGHKLIDRLIKAARALAEGELAETTPRPPELSGPLTGLGQVFALGAKARFFSGYYNRTVEDLTAQAANATLTRILGRLFLPQVPLWFTAMILGLLSKGRLLLCTDGSSGFVRALERRFLDLGGQISYRSTVARIVVNNHRVSGVELEKGEQLSAGTVISTADGYSTIYKLLDGRYLDKRIAGRFEDMELFWPFLMFNCGTGLDLSRENWSVEVELPKDLRNDLLPDSWLSVRIFNYGSGFAPAGRTLVQVITLADWSTWADLRADKKAYLAAKEEVGQAILAALDRTWPGLVADVDMTDLATPQTIWRYTLNRRGAWEGFLPTPKALRRNLRRTLPGLEGLVLAGQWVMPGGGVIPSLVSGRQAVELICRSKGV